MIPEYVRIMDESELEDVQKDLVGVFERIRVMKCDRPGYTELGPALIYISKANDMLELAKNEVRS